MAWGNRMRFGGQNKCYPPDGHAGMIKNLTISFFFQSLRKGFQIYTGGSIDDMLEYQGCESEMQAQDSRHYVSDEITNLIQSNGKGAFSILCSFYQLNNVQIYSDPPIVQF